VAGENVEEPPSGDLEAPDVVFDTPGVVKIVVASQNAANGTRVRVRITMKGNAILSDFVTLVNGQAEFHINVPSGEGTIQAYSERFFSYSDEHEGGGQPQS
jgi:hypothetical protein